MLTPIIAHACRFGNFCGNAFFGAMPWTTHWDPMTSTASTSAGTTEPANTCLRPLLPHRGLDPKPAIPRVRKDPDLPHRAHGRSGGYRLHHQQQSDLEAARQTGPPHT